MKKAKSHGLTFTGNGSLEKLIELHEKWVLPKVKGMYAYQYETVRILYNSLRRHFNLSVAMVEFGNCLAASGLFIEFNQRIIYFFGATSDVGKSTGASTLLLDSIIKEYSNSKCVLDFNGGNLNSLAYFYSGFGAERKYSKVISVNRFPIAIKKIHHAWIWLRRKVIYEVDFLLKLKYRSRSSV